MPVGIPATSAFSMLLRKKNLVDDVYYTISVENITVGHSGVVHLKYGQGSVEAFGELEFRWECLNLREKKYREDGENYIIICIIIIIIIIIH
jgi:hypothetical protein